MAERGRFRHRIAVRYGEVDQQGVVFNAHYLAWCDDAMERWMRSLDLHVGRLGWDFMLKRAELEWQDAATTGDIVDIDVAVTRWGRTSFTVGFRGTVGDRPVFTCTITYVGVRLGTREPLPPPPQVRRSLGEPLAVVAGEP